MTRREQGLVEFGHCLMITDSVSFFSFLFSRAIPLAIESYFRRLSRSHQFNRNPESVFKQFPSLLKSTTLADTVEYSDSRGAFLVRTRDLCADEEERLGKK